MIEYGMWNIWTCSLMFLVIYSIYNIIIIEFFAEPERFKDKEIGTKTHIKDLSYAVKEAERAIQELLGTKRIGIITLTNYNSTPTTFSFDVKIYDYSRYIIQNFFVSLKKPMFKNDYIVDKLENTDNTDEINNGTFDVVNNASYSGLKPSP